MASKSVKPPASKILFFAYGTLKQGYVREGFLSGCDFLGAGLTSLPCLFYLTPENYPVLVLPSDSLSQKVSGEVYVINPVCEKRLDWVEGYPDIYQKSRISIEVGESIYECLTYTMESSRIPLEWERIVVF